MPTFVKTGDTVIVTIPIKNNGTEIANNIEVTVILPTGVSYNTDSPSVGTYTSGTGVWAIPQLIAGQDETLELTLNITDDCQLPGNITWSVTAVDENDPLAGNDSSLEIVGNDNCCQLFPCLSQDGSYDNSVSGLVAENIQDAIDEAYNDAVQTLDGVTTEGNTTSNAIGVGDTTISSILRLVPTTTPGAPAEGMIFIDSAEDNHIKYYDGTEWRHLFQPNIGVYTSLDSATPTTITTGGTYYPIAGTFSNLPIEKFSAQTEAYGPVLQYDGLDTLYFEVDTHSSASGDSNDIAVIGAIKKNNVLVSESAMGTYLKNTGEHYTFSGTSVVELSTGDNIQFVVTADGDGDVITFQHLTASIRPFFSH